MKHLQKECMWFDRALLSVDEELTTNEKKRINSTQSPFALSLSKGRYQEFCKYSSVNK
jgi:hypothetical protein